MTDLIIFPTAPALRQWQKRQLETTDFLDSRGMMTNAAFLAQCAAAASQHGFLHAEGQGLRMGDDFDRELAIVEACRAFRQSDSDTPVLGRLSDVALEEVVGRVIHYVAPLADQAESFLQILEKDDNAKNRELAELYRHFDAACLKKQVAPRARINAAILTMLADRSLWPVCIHGDVSRIVFRGLRWVPPFVESVSALLEAGLGKGSVVLSHILEEYEQDWWAQKLFPQTGNLIFGESREGWEPYHASATIGRLDHFLSLRDAAAVSDAAIAEECRGHIGFNESVGLYGEVQDIARRIAHAIQNGTPPDRICLTARKLGDYSDAVTDVFQRFGIPYYFRRGIPVMSTSVVKDVLLVARFAVTRRRDDLCAILSSRWLDFSSFFKTGRYPMRADELAHVLKVSGVEPRIDELLSVENRLKDFYRRNPDAEAVVSECMDAIKSVMMPERGSPARLVGLLLKSCGRQHLDVLGRIRSWSKRSLEGDRLARRSYILNARAYSSLLDVMQSLKEETSAGKGSVRWSEVLNLLERALANLTIHDPHSSDSGVWVLTPHDLAGLSFDMVCCAGMNSGEFPALPEQSPLFSDLELVRFREAISTSLPAAVLAVSEARNSQENLLFLSVLASATKQLVFSRTAKDESGVDVPESVYFTTLWRLAGFPAAGSAPEPSILSPYERWRLEHGGAVYAEAWQEISAHTNPFERRPFPGESWLGILPGILCRAEDEMRQSAAAGKANVGSAEPGQVEPLVERGLFSEQKRMRFFDDAASGKTLTDLLEDGDTARFVGVLEEAAWKALQPDGLSLDFSPTALETLAVCPYKFYLSRVLYLEKIQTNELEASPMDYGSAVHEIMNVGMRLLRGDQDLPARLPKRAMEPAQRHAHLCHPSWLTPETDGWRLVDSNPGVEGALPAVVMDLQSKLDDYVDFFGLLCDVMQEAVERGELNWMMGAPEQSDLTWNRIRSSISCLLEAQRAIEPKHFKKKFSAGGDPHIEIGEDPLQRCTVFLEQVFDDREWVDSVSGAITLRHPDDPARSMKIHGVVDRVDLLCDTSGAVRAIHVIDYKGRSKAGKRPDVLAQEIVEGLDCQLPVYGLMARRCLFPDGGGDELPVILQYLVYNNSVKDMCTNLRNHFICLDGRPLEEDALKEITGGPELLDAFTHKLFELVAILEGGRFVVQSSSCDYCDFASQCRNPMSLLKLEGDYD